MYSRPTSKETEDDILKLQEEFLKQTAANEVVPAAKTVVLKKNEPQNETPQEDPGSIAQVHLENTFESIPSDIYIGQIVEKTSPTPNTVLPSFVHKQAFPQVKRRDPTVSGSTGSLFSQQIKRLKRDQPESSRLIKITIRKRDLKDAGASSNDVLQPMDTSNGGANPQGSYIVTCSQKDEIHKQNMGVLQHMTEEQILKERETLLSTMDPAIVAFLKAKREHGNESRTVSIAEQNKVAENVIVEDIEASNEVIMHPNADKWLNFDMLETTKLAWMTNIDIPKLEEGQSYEARFDFSGWLLPFNETQIDEKTRSLYHHGEEPGRPGYTLQELFQLCRSSVGQQKIVALNTIANILLLQQSGSYDGIIEMPFEQIFFVLRFCLDDNTPAILNASIKAIRNLFFYPIDETCLDNLLGFGLGLIQPIIAVNNTEIEDDTTINDQQLAETNLVKCLARTDILKRIRYIVNTVLPSTETVIYCLDILTRLARDSEFIINHLFTCNNLLDSIIKHFVPKSYRLDNSKSPYGCPLIQAVKLFRILATRSEEVAAKLINRYEIMESITAYLSDEALSVNANGLKLQIESLHLWCVFIRWGLAVDYVRNLEPILWRMLDFHVRNTDALPTTSYIIQGHSAALLNLLTEIVERNFFDMAVFIPLISGLGVAKWTAQFASIEEFTCGKLQIITSFLRCLTALCKYKSTTVKISSIETAIAELLLSTGFNIVTSNIRVGSNLLSSSEAHKTGANLKSVEAAVWNASDHIVPTLHTRSCVPFLNVLSEFIANSQDHQLKLTFLNHNNINKYLKSMNQALSFNLIDNWFTRLESQLIINVLKIAVDLQNELDTALFYEIAVKCLSIFDAEQKEAIEFVLSKIVFSPRFYPCETLLDNLNISESNDLLKQALDNLSNILKVYTEVLDLKMVKRTDLFINVSSGSIMPIDWIYSPIILLYSNQQANKSSVAEDKQIFIVTNCLRWIYIYEMYFPALAKLINPTDRFCRLACTFLGSDTLFFNPEIHDLLEACLKHLLLSNEKNINFSKPIQGLNNFQDFYTQLLEQYQGVSYGDVLFGNFILLPLIQRHDVKYRKTLWSEYAGVVQTLNVKPEQVLCPKELFLNPPETDISVLVSYQRALINGTVRQHSFLYQVAHDHLGAFSTRKQAERRNRV